MYNRCWISAAWLCIATVAAFCPTRTPPIDAHWQTHLQQHHEQPTEPQEQDSSESCHPPCSRRSLLVGGGQAALMILATGNRAVWAEDDESSSLTQKLFNADGSLKDATDTTVSFRTVTISLPLDQTSVLVQDATRSSTTSNNSVQVQYDLPEMWNDKYQNANKEQFCDTILVYRPAGDMDEKTFTSAVKKGVVSTLQLSHLISGTADLLSAKTNSNSGALEYDLAVAPQTCASSATDNLGLGFCPYDTIYLLSTLLYQNQLYVLLIRSTKEQWKVGSAELKRVRSSFRIANTA